MRQPARRRSITRLTLTVLGATVSGLAAMTIATPLLVDAAGAPVRLTGKGAAEVSGELVGWQDALAAAEQPVDLNYLTRGSDEGRNDLLRGVVDYAISGVPFSDDELARKPEGAGALISAPVSAAALAVVFTTPPAGVGAWNTYREDAACMEQFFLGNVLDPEECITRGVFTGPWRVGPANMTALMLGIDPAFQANRLSAWSDPGWKAAIGTEDLQIGLLPNAHHTWVNRTEGAAANRYLMEYAKAMAPDVWTFATTVWQPDDPANPFDYQWEPLQNRFSTRSVSRFGLETMMGLMALSEVDAQTGAYHEGFTGNAGAIPSTLVEEYLAQYPRAGFHVMEIQNANGDWVTPTTESIGAAIAAGDTPDIAASQKIPGAYPLTWINRLYTFAGTLDPDQANALAATIRYLATDGQDAVVAHGGAALTQDLVDEALAAADLVVTANCPADTHTVVVGGPGPMEPTTPKVSALTGLAHCEVPTAPTTTTTIATSTTTTVPAASTTTTTVAVLPPTTRPYVFPGSSGGGYVPPRSSGGSSSGGSSSGGGGGSTASTTPPTVAESVPDESTAPSTEPVSAPSTTVPADGPSGLRLGRGLGALPMGLPDDGTQGFKKVGTFVLGALGFLLARSLVLRRRVSA